MTSSADQARKRGRARNFARAATASLLIACAGCGGSSGTSSPPPPDHRVLGLAANPRGVPPPTQQDYLDAVNLAINAGARGIVETNTWSSLEPAPGQYALQNLQNDLTFQAQEGFEIYLGIQVINTVPKEVPADLMNVAWDDPQMKARFHSLLDAIRPLLNSHVAFLSIGNEVDVYLTQHPSEWVAYESFFEDALSYVHQTMPGIAAGVTTTFGGASGAGSANVAALNTKSDVWMLTYYPLGAGYVVEPAQSPVTDFQTMLGLAGTKNVVLQEVGYPSAAILSSSEANQAAFVTAFFQAWQTAGQRIPFLSFFLLHDLTPDVCAQLNAYYQVPPDAAFQAYLCTLGLRRDDDTVKASWQAFLNGAAADGFPH